MKGTLVIGPVCYPAEERDLQTSRLILGNNQYLKFSLQEITCCHHDYLFIFTPVNNNIQEIKRKTGMQFCWEDCEETDQQSRINSIVSFPMHIFMFKGTWVCLLCFARLDFILFSGPYTNISCLRWILQTSRVSFLLLLKF